MLGSRTIPKPASLAASRTTCGAFGRPVASSDGYKRSTRLQAASAAAPLVQSASAASAAAAAAATAAAEAAASSGLARYRWPSSAPASASEATSRATPVAGAAWFEAAVQRIAKHADEAPFLQLVHRWPLLHMSRVELAADDAAAGWAGVAERLAAANADSVILVHPVSSEQEACIKHTCSASGAGAVAQSVAGTLPSAGASSCGGIPVSDVMAGRVGDCCDTTDEDEAAGPVASDFTAAGDSSFAGGSSGSSHRSPNRSRRAAARAAAAAATSSHQGPTTAYFGLVVQCKQDKQLQGCYLLKTVRTTHGSAAVGGCRCTHYTLTRVCKGQPLAQQLQASWLL